MRCAASRSMPTTTRSGTVSISPRCCSSLRFCIARARSSRSQICSTCTWGSTSAFLSARPVKLGTLCNFANNSFHRLKFFNTKLRSPSPVASRAWSAVTCWMQPSSPCSSWASCVRRAWGALAAGTRLVGAVAWPCEWRLRPNLVSQLDVQTCTLILPLGQRGPEKFCESHLAGWCGLSEWLGYLGSSVVKSCGCWWDTWARSGKRCTKAV